MNYLKKIFSICSVMVFFFAASISSVFAFSSGPPDGLTEAPGEGNCTQCHSGNSLNASGGTLVLGVPGTYLPGEMYDIVVDLSRSGQSRWGFEMTALNGNGARAGTFTPANNGNTQVTAANSKQYIKQTTQGSASGTRDKNQWAFKWTAPTNDVGPITFYAAGNAANGDFGTSGDYIYTQKATSEVPVYGVTLAGVGSLKTETTDANAAVTYTLKVTNTSNTNDTINLSTSGDASATLSPTTVPLDAGAARNVTLTVSGNALTTAGDYEVKVKATSQGDSTKTAEVTTTTTVPPVYGVTLVGVGTLTRETTRETANASNVSYTLRVTNTGNTSDTVRLTTSGDVTATLSRTLIPLDYGKSSVVSVSIRGDALTAAGDYAVKVIATSQGDTQKTAEVTTTTTVLPVYGVTLAGVGELTTETVDASEGVSYMLTVTNTGNTDDVIDLSTSGDVAGTLSDTSISLASGASANVTLTVSGEVLVTAGTYEVKVTATSQEDTKKTAEASTKTTILPVYGVTLTGVGELTTETADASEGVSYMLTVTNTGNTDDVIDLVASGDAAATLSQDSVSLATGASTEVTLTVSDALLTTAGDYEVKVTATSQGDNTKTAAVSTTTTILPVYGVTLAGVGDLMTETSDASEGISYMLTVTNTGNTDDVIDLTSSDDAAILSQTSVSLAAGASAEVTITISGDDLATAGDYEVKVTATSQGDEEKTAEVTTKTTILPIYGVTLAGVGELTTETTDASEGVSYKFTVTNTGNTDDVIDLTSSDDAVILSQTSVSLAAGASTEVTITLSGDDLATAGDYEVSVTATSQGDTEKTTEASTKTTILPVYGVTLAGVGELTTETVDASEGVSYMLTITNTGNTDDVIDLTSSDDAVILSQTSVSLAAGASAEVTITISGDDLATAGDYKVSVMATSQGDTEKTTEVSTKTTILPVYGVTLTGVGDLMTETSDASEGISYMLTVTNTGNTDDIIDLTTSGDAAATLSQDSVSLATGASTEVTLTVSDALLTTAGDYEVKVTATSQGDNTKTAAVSTTTTILPVYGVTLAGVGDLMTETSDASEGISYMLTVTNTGNTDDMIDLTTSGDAAATLSQDSVSLATGASTEVTLTVSDALLTTAGDYEVKVTATSQRDNTKTAEVTTTTTILPVYGVTLTGAGDLMTETSDASEGISYTLKITNISNTDDVIDLTSSDDAATLSQTSVSLAEGASTEVTITISGDALATAGNYEVNVTATSQGDNTMSSEVSTNTKILPVYGVTLAGVGELTTETSDASEGVSYMLTVTNTGNTDDIIDLVTSGDAAATLSQDSVSLAAGASTEVTLTVSDAVLTTAGDYEVKVTATSQGDNTKTAAVSTTTTILPVYGVTLADVGDLTTETSDASEGVTYTLTIANTGNTDDVIDLTSSDDAATLSQTSVPLAGGASAEVTITISGDALATAGNYEVKITATSQGDNTMSSEVTTNTTILPVYGVTLAGVDELTTKTSDASEGVTYTLTIANTGNTDDVIDLTSSDDAATLSQTSVPLAGGASAEVTITISGDALATAGNYEVKITATSQGDNTMSSEVTTNTTILPVYGVTLTGVGELTTKTSDASEGVSYMLTVTNTGNTDDVIDLVASGDAAATLSQDSVPLAAGASTEVTLTVSDAALTTAGDYEVKVTATSQGNNTKTDAVSTTTTILPVYGVTLAGAGDLMTETSDASEGVSYTLKITNISNTDDVIDLTTSGDAAATLSQTVVPLAAGASAEIILTISGDDLALASQYEVKVTATSQVDKTKTAVISTKTTILPVYGVTLAGVGELTSKTADASEGVSYMLTVTNTGNTDDVIDLTSSDDAATLSQTSVSLAEGASTEVTITISGDALATAGNYEVNVTATSQGDNTMSSEVSTNTKILPVYGVTLAGVGELTTETSDASEGVSYMLTVTNTGNTDDMIDLVTSGDAAATLSQDSVSLAAGASTEVTLIVSDAVLTTAGDYEVKVTATSQGDNTKTAAVSTTTTILPVYGVTLAGVGNLTTETSDASEGISYTLKITNISNTDDVIDLTTSGDAATLSQTVVPLAAGASAEIILTISGDDLAIAGQYEVKVTATSQGDNTMSSEVSTNTTILPVYGVTLAGVGELTTETVDASEGVSYMLTVTNTGNTDDVIDLTSSDDAAILSQASVSLAGGASTEVTITISGDALATAGNYEVNVTATSQGDNTMSSEVSTNTTILPVYGVTLAGVGGELTGTTMDMLAGVSYTLTVTNTGNTDDTVVLGSSAEFGIEGSVLGSFSQSDDQEPTTSQLEIMLAAGASAEVIFTAAGDFFTKPGEYEIKVTATSQGDSTKTAELTTNTTIEPVPWDLNADGTVNILDLVAVANQFGESGEGLSGDVNMDGEVNILDLVQVASYFGKTQAEIVQANQ